MPNVTAGYEMYYDLIEFFFWEICLKRYSVTKLLQIGCYGRNVLVKNKPNHLWLRQSEFFCKMKPQTRKQFVMKLYKYIFNFE